MRGREPRHDGGDGGWAGDAPAVDDVWAAFKEEVVNIAKPVLRVPYEKGELTRETFKQILKKVADKVVKGYQTEGLPPPEPNELPTKQTLKIERLTNEYIVLLKKA